MKCVVCKKGETKKGSATISFDKKSTMIVIRNVPAKVCNNCGEEYVNDKTAKRILRIAEEAKKAGVEIDVRSYMAA